LTVKDLVGFPIEVLFLREESIVTRSSRIFVFFAALFVSTLAAQVDTATISGSVKDPSGAVIVGASVQVKNPNTGFTLSLSTNGQGIYSAPNLKVGSYEVTVGANGFQTVTRSNIEVRVQDHLNVNFDLQVGQATQVVSVESQVSPIETETTALGESFGSQRILGLPLNGRNYIQLATLTPGTSPSVRTQERNTFVSNGARPIQNSYLLDGIDNKNKIVGFDNSTAQSVEPVVDAIAEFKVDTSTFSAEFGQAAGAVVNATIKSGTNSFHGSAFEFLRNSVLDATPYFQPAGAGKPQFIQNQFGATLGGPIIKNRTFFFFAWQSSREVNAAPQLAIVPTLLQREGAFSAAIYDPATTVANPAGNGYARSQFPNNTVPASRFDPVAAKILALYPLPNLSGKFNFFSNQRESIDNDQYIGRIDHRFSERDSTFARFVSSANTNVLPATLPPPASSPSIVTPEAHTFAWGETHIFTPTLINEARVGYQETREQQNIDGTRLFDQYGIKGAPDIPQVLGLPTFAVSGLTIIGTTGPGSLPTPATGSGNLPIDKQGRTIQVDDTLSSVRGKHTIKYGFDFQQVTLYANSTLNARPGYTFSGVYTQDPQNRSQTGSALADFLLGQTATATLSTRSISESRQHIYQGFVQDDWTISDRLTINAGLRYELPLPFYETAGHYSNLILEPGSLYGQILDASNAAAAGYRNSFVDPNWHNFAPRLGFAYRITPKTVLRVAAGIFYGRDENVPVARRPTNNPPYFLQTTYTTDQIDPNIVLSEGFPDDALDPANVKHPSVNAYLKHSPTPYVQQWNVNLQRELGAGFVAQGSYVGSSAHDLYYPNQIDVPPPGPGAVQPRRPLAGYSAIYEYGPYVSSNYESLQAELKRRFNNGLSFQASYTYAHSIDNGPSQTDNDIGPQNPFDFSAERGSSNFDIRQRLVIDAVAALPFGKGKRWLNEDGWASTLAGGWQLTGIFSAQTGLPFTPFLSFDPTNTGHASANGSSAVRPNCVGNPSVADPGPQLWFNPSAFVNPSGYSYGNCGRDILTGPGFHNIDLELSRFFGITERIHIEFRAEAFNLFNTPQFGLPQGELGVSTTGTISTVINPQRELQLALRLAF
jgi:Carboxypeptidase regulatory-like domain/TonB dependent receptor